MLRVAVGVVDQSAGAHLTLGQRHLQRVERQGRGIRGHHELHANALGRPQTRWWIDPDQYGLIYSRMGVDAQFN